jgi:hypothetical protein
VLLIAFTLAVSVVVTISALVEAVKDGEHETKVA